MRTIALLASLLFAPVSGPKGPAPKIVEQHTNYNFECDDPLGAGCRFQSVTIENKRFEPVLVRINCGSEYDESELKVYARTKLTVTIETPEPLGPAGCTLGSWEPIVQKKK